MTDEYYTVQEVAKIFRVSDETIRNQITKGKIKAIRIGDVYRIPKTVLELFRSASEVVNGEK